MARARIRTAKQTEASIFYALENQIKSYLKVLVFLGRRTERLTQPREAGGQRCFNTFSCLLILLSESR